MLRLIFLISLLAACSCAVSVDINQSISIETDGSEEQTKAPVVHRVSVGRYDETFFQPNQLNANVGDRIIFEFHGGNHTLTESTFERPCTPLKQFDSGFNQFNPISPADLAISFVVNSPESRWFFCRQRVPLSHCHAGMVFALNPGDRMTNFLENVQKGTHAQTPTASTQAPAPTATVTISTTVSVTETERNSCGQTGQPGTGIIQPVATGSGGIATDPNFCVKPTGTVWHSSGTGVPRPPRSFTSIAFSDDASDARSGALYHLLALGLIISLFG